MKIMFNIFSNRLNILKFLFYIFPAIMLTSSGYITAYTSALTIFALYYFYYYKIKINLYLLDYLIIFFFILSIISTFINVKLLGNYIFFKSILDIRFAVLFFLTRNIINYKIINIRIFSFIVLICTIFLSLNIFLQHLIGFDILGHPPFDGRYNGLFESEAIAGSYLQKFSLFAIFSILLFKSNKNINFFLTIFIINLLALGILMSLDRMPFIIYLFSHLVLIILSKKFRLRFLISFVTIIFLFLILFNNYSIIKKRYLSLYNEINFFNFKESIFLLNKKIETVISPNQIRNDKIELSGDYDYLRIFNAAYEVFLTNPIIGSGVKSFGIKCPELKIKNQNLNCLSHPHNIYLEILVNQGIIGILIFIVFLIILLKKNYFGKLLKKNTNEKNLLSIIFLTLLIAELLPIRSFGSIFQTVNGTIFWFFLALASSKFYNKKGGSN
jgi:O-antigen ligase